MRASFKTLLAAVLIVSGAAAAELSTASAQSTSRQILTGQTGVYAQYRGARYYRGSFAPRRYGGYRRAAYYGPRYGYRRAYYGPRYSYRRAAYYGPRYGYYRRYPYRYYRRGFDGGGAVVAGLIGGLTLGALANPYYGYGPAYYYRPAYFAPRCVIERRRVVNRYGRYVWRRVQVCY